MAVDARLQQGLGSDLADIQNRKNEADLYHPAISWDNSVGGKHEQFQQNVQR